MAATPVDSASEIAVARAWLKAEAAPHRRLASRAGMLVVADVVPAAVTAIGLALAVSGVAAGDATRSASGAVLAGFGLLARAVLGRWAVEAGARLGLAARADVRGRLTEAVLTRGSAGADGVTLALEGVDALQGWFSRYVPARMTAAVSPLLLIGLAALASPVAAAILLGTMIPFILGMALAGTAAAAQSRRQFEAMTRLSGVFLDRIRALPDLVAFQAEGATAKDLSRASNDLSRRTQGVLAVAFLSSGILEFFSALAVALVAVYCGFNLLRLLPFPVPEQLDLARAFFVLALAPEVYAPIRRLAAAYHERQTAEAAAPALARALERSQPVERAPALQRAPSIAFERVTVRFDERQVLEAFSLDIQPGETVAIMGASGSGKTTLLRMLLGLTRPQGGLVLVNGRDLAAVGELSASIGWAGQAPVVTPGTLADNIRLGRLDATDAEVATAAAYAGLHLDLNRVLDERGGGLSGGERRRLGLARAFLKNAPILLLDEPTANLDGASEAALLPSIRSACQGRTTLIATHSETLAALADRVVRL
ncbi:thiol reductant ABC exporter subunit CydD [Brevundimonas sp. 2R-24]|uniref:Thiol reductant ABC exporter subunit CydD n=1 Tax=Peiella sedimenti TaxID=3061083 RepID=A0ABT8SJP4_9CAUL|nr:thiol reductant ABC exporter subunit CydD [Caulobacteraceae bacterium XZ-24]